MAYTPTVWKNGEFPPIDAEHLNKIEQGIANSAPGGFGLGEDATIPEGRSANNITASGFYYCDKDTPNSNDWMILHIQRDAGHAVQFGRTYNQNSGWPMVTRVRNTSISNAWQPWEWLTPPMELGVEYRTTERYLGKPVYVKTINMGNLPGNAVKMASFQSNNVVDKIVSVTGQCTTDSGVNVSMPYHTGSGPNWNTVILIGADGSGAAQIVTFAPDFSEYKNACITVKYTKLAD